MATVDEIRQITKDALDSLQMEKLEALRDTIAALSKEGFQALLSRETSIKMVFQWLKDSSELTQNHEEDKKREFFIKWLSGMVKTFSSQLLVYIMEQIMVGVRSNNMIVGTKLVLELLPLVLQELGEMSSVTLPENHHAVSGPVCRDFYITRLIDVGWKKELILPLACALQDLSFNATQLQSLVKKLIATMKNVDHQELPPLVYQMLLLSKQGCKKNILEGLVHFLASFPINGNTPETTAQLQSIHSTIIVHICMGLKNDQTLSGELAKIMKTTTIQSPLALKPLNLALLLSILRNHRLGDNTIDSLRTVIVSNLKDSERLQSAPWIEVCTSWKVVDVKQTLTDLLRTGRRGWEDMIQGMIELGFALIDGNRNLPSLPTSDKEPIKKKEFTIQDQASELGSWLLAETFKQHEIVRIMVLDNLVARILGNNSHIHTYIDLLTKLVQDCPQVFLEQINKVRDAFDEAVYRNTWLAPHLLSATKSLIRLNVPYKDHIMLTLRKGLFSKEVESREVSVRGYLQVVKALMEPGHAIPTAESEVLEIVGNLRRALVYSDDIKTWLYHGLVQIMTLQPRLASPILGILLPHAEKHLKEHGGAPFNLVDAVSETEIKEPVPSLISTLCHALVCNKFQAPNSDSKGKGKASEGSNSPVWNLLDGLIQRMLKAEVEMFGFDKESDYTDGSDIGKFNLSKLQILAHVYDALIFLVFSLKHGNKDTLQEMSTTMTKLFEQRKKNLDVISKWKEDEQRKKGKEISVENPFSFVQLSTLSKICRFLLFSTANTENSTKTIMGNLGLYKHLLGTMEAKLSSLEGQDLDNSTKEAGKDMAALMLRATAGRLLQRYEFNTTERATASIMYTCILNAIKALSNDKAKVLECLHGLGELNVTFDDAVLKLAEVFDQVTSQRLRIAHEKDEKPTSPKDTMIVLQVITQLYSISPSPTLKDRLFPWAQKACENHAIPEVALAKSLVNFLLSVDHGTPTPVLANPFSNDIYRALGAHSDASDIPTSPTTLRIVSQATAASLLMLLLMDMEKTVDEIEWVITQWKEIMGKGVKSDDEAYDDACDLERAMCEQLASICQALVRIMCTAVPAGALTEPLLRLGKKYYNVMGSLVKTRCLNQAAIQNTLSKLLKSTSSLTAHVNCFLLFLQSRDRQGDDAMDEDSDDGKKRKRKGKEKKVNLASISREGKSVPNLVFAMETYEKKLIELGRKVDLDLKELVKRTVTRDFRR